MQLTKIADSFQRLASFVEDPLGAVLNALVRIALTIAIPFPIPDEIIIQLRSSILQILLAILMVIIITIIGLVGVITIPFTHQVSITAPTSDSSFTSTDIPFQNPLGGTGLSYVRITASFHDLAYYAQFGLWHEGIDFVPSDLYYQQSKAYNDPSNTSHSIIIFSTINGTVDYYQDQYGSNTVEVLNKEGTLKIIYMHLNEVFVKTGQIITAGTAVGTMGDTGFSTGEHLHYQIDVNNNGTWTPVDPLGYIKQ